MKTKLFVIFTLALLHLNVLNAEEFNKELSFYTGTFDVIDKEGDDQTSLFGVEHRNPELFRDTFLGKLSPITGGFVTENSAAYIYTGIEWNVDMGGGLTFTPSFAPGLYHEGDGKDLGHIVEFKSEVQLSYSSSEKTNFGVSYNHVSNASLGDKNPGANSYMFNFIRNF